MKAIKILSACLIVMLLSSCLGYRYGRRSNGGQGEQGTEQFQPGQSNSGGGASTDRRSGYGR